MAQIENLFFKTVLTAIAILIYASIATAGEVKIKPKEIQVVELPRVVVIGKRDHSNIIQVAANIKNGK